MALGAGELIIVWAAVWAFVIAGIADAVKRPDEAWQAAGRSKMLWIGLQAGGLFLCLIGAVITLVYFASVRPQLAAAE